MADGERGTTVVGPATELDRKLHDLANRMNLVGFAAQMLAGQKHDPMFMAMEEEIGRACRLLEQIQRCRLQGRNEAKLPSHGGRKL